MRFSRNKRLIKRPFVVPTPSSNVLSRRILKEGVSQFRTRRVTWAPASNMFATRHRTPTPKTETTTEADHRNDTASERFNEKHTTYPRDAARSTTDNYEQHVVGQRGALHETNQRNRIPICHRRQLGENYAMKRGRMGTATGRPRGFQCSAIGFAENRRGFPKRH